MARSSQYWVMVLLVIFVAAVTATLVGASEAQPTITEQAKAAHETVKNEAAPTIAEKIENSKQATQAESKKEVEQVGEAVKTWKDWAVKTAGEWTGTGKGAAGDASETAKSYYTKTAEGLYSSSAKAQEAVSGLYSKWSNWAKETTGKYRPQQNPAAKAAEYVNKHTSGSTEEDL